MKHAAAWPVAFGILWGVTANAHAAPEPVPAAGTYAFVQGGDEGFAQSTTDGSLVSYQAGPYQASAQAAFGVNRVYASALGADGGIEAGSLWTEKFTVDAPLGQSVLVTFSVQLSGTNSAPFSEFDGGGEYDLLVHTAYRTPLELLADIDVDDNPALIKASIDQAAYQSVWVKTYAAKGGDILYVSSILDVGAVRDQVLDFSHSAHVGISVSPGASLLSSSGTVYAAAVPEAGGAWLAVAGLMVLGLSRRRHASR